MLNQDNNLQDTIGKNLQQQATLGQFSTTQVPNHVHNGSDSSRINGADIIPNNKFIISLALTSGTVAENTVTLQDGIQNPSALNFNCIAYNSAKTNKATATGHAELGNAARIGLTGTVENPGNTIAVVSIDSGVAQTSSSFYTTGSHVGASGDNICYITDGTNTVATVTITKFTDTSITLVGYIISDWTLIGWLTIA